MHPWFKNEVVNGHIKSYEENKLLKVNEKEHINIDLDFSKVVAKGPNTGKTISNE